jgi:hypothetical protein
MHHLPKSTGMYNFGYRYVKAVYNLIYNSFVMLSAEDWGSGIFFAPLPRRSVWYSLALARHENKKKKLIAFAALDLSLYEIRSKFCQLLLNQILLWTQFRIRKSRFLTLNDYGRNRSEPSYTVRWPVLQSDSHLSSVADLNPNEYETFDGAESEFGFWYFK